MRPSAALLILAAALSFFLLQPAASVCVPRRSPTTFPDLPLPPTPSPSPSPSPPLAPTTTATTTPTPSLFTTFSIFDSDSLSRILKSFCSHTDFSDLCLKSIAEAAPTLQSATNATVLAALMKAVDHKAHEARAFAQKLATDSSFDTRTRGLLSDCADNYDDALDNLEAASEAVRARDDGTRDAMLSAVISNVGTCEDGFQEFAVKSPLANWSKTLQNMADNCLAIINLGRPQDDY